MTDTPARRGRPPKVMAQPVDRLAQLTEREKALALKARARHRYTFDMPLEMYEALLNQAEAWDQPLPDVVRACIRKGLEHIQRFGGGSDHNPYVYGKLNPPAQHDIDPTGLGWPPTGPAYAPFTDGHNTPISIPALPEPREVPGRMQFKPPVGLMPNGYTSDMDQLVPKSAPAIPHQVEDDT